MGFRLLASARRIHEREDDSAAVEVVAGSVDPPSFRAQQLRVEVGRLVQIGHLQGHTEEVRNLSHLSSPRIGGCPTWSWIPKESSSDGRRHSNIEEERPVRKRSARNGIDDYWPD